MWFYIYHPCFAFSLHICFESLAESLDVLRDPSQDDPVDKAPHEQQQCLKDRHWPPCPRCGRHNPQQNVDGVYTTDPRITPRARKLAKITYEEMLEMASQGAKVLQTRSVGMAMTHQVRVLVRSSFADPDDPQLVAATNGTADLPGTLVCDEEEIMEQELVTGIAYSRDEAKITLVDVEDKPGVSAAIFGPLADAGINVDMIVQNVSEDGSMTDLTFTVSNAELDKARSVIEGAKDEIGYQNLISDGDVSKISVIGVGMRSHTGVAQKMFRALADRGINIHVISTSEIKVSVLIASEYTELAVRALHTAYGLDGEAA